ncbi:MAG: PEP-CTERM system TPR-repeat protein PrsT [Rhodocyclales bacterium GT-UBC]|nr:MAG: PEP-CTERM system TPR-repeat protein PrsT [Rhodocyclales bacterium GT-UBC]
MYASLQTVVALVLLMALSGATWANNPKAARYYEDALKRFEVKDMPGAVIQLKNAIQQDRTMLAAQVLLGKALLVEGDPIGAEVAFDEALNQGVDRGEVILFLGQAYLMQGKFDTLVSKLSTTGLSGGLRRDVLLLRAKAYAEQGSLVQAEGALDEAKSIDPRSAIVRAAQGGLMLRQGRLADAARFSEEAWGLGPDEVSVIELKASILHLKGDAKGALAAYDRLVALYPRNLDARVARVGLLLDLGRQADAATEVDEILRISPNEPRGNYLQAVLSSRKGDEVKARASLKKVADLLGPVPASVLAANKQMMLLLPLAHHGLGNLEKSEVYLVNYLRRYPGEIGAAKLLASIYLQRGQSAKVMSLLEPYKARYASDPRLLSLLAAAYMTERRYAQASALLEESLKLSGDMPDIRADLGLSLLGDGRSDAGMEQLQQAFAKDPTQTRAGIALATLLLRKGQADKAKGVAESLAKARPDDVVVLNLLGGIKGASGDLVGAEQAYQRVLQLEPGHRAAMLNMVRTEISLGKSASARSRLTSMLQAAPNNTDPMIELAELEMSLGNEVEAIRWLEKARSYPSGAVRAGLQLIDIFLKQRSFDKALAVAKDVQLKDGGSLGSLGALARVQLAMGAKQEARKTLGDMARLANFDPDAQVSIAGLQRAAGNDQGARYSLEKALNGAPGNVPAQVMLIEIEIAQREFEKAESKIKALSQQSGNSVVAARLTGDLQLARGQYVAAASTYRALLGKKGADGVVLQYFRASELAGGRQQGIRGLEEWVKSHPNDLLVARVLGDAYLGGGDLAGARRVYERLLKVKSDDAHLLNNQAQVLLRQGDKAALGFAEKAYQLSGRDPAVIDTLGTVLVSQGQYERGLGLLRDARLRDPENREIRYHLAVALMKSGRLAEAKEELAHALKGGANFEGVAEAKKLFAELGR